LSRDLQPIYTKSFVNRLHLVLHACVETFDVTFFSVYEVYGVETKQDLSDFCEVLFSERRRTRVGFVFPSVRVVTWRQEQRRAGGADPSARADARWSVATATGWGMELQVEFRENPSYLLRFLGPQIGETCTEPCVLSNNTQPVRLRLFR